MTTLHRPPAVPRATAPATTPASAREMPGRNDRVLALATLTVAAGVLLTMLPLRSIFTDWSWLAVNIGCALPYLLVVTSARWSGRAQVWPVVAGLLASGLVLLWVFVPDHLFYGVVPTSSSWTDFRSLLNQAHETMQGGHAPLASTGPLRLLTASATILLIALTDLLGVLWRKPLLAAAPLLEVLAVASATSSRAAHPLFFASAAVGFLLILVAGTRLQDLDWGPSVDGSDGRLGGARRMATAGIVAALVLPLALPSVSVNVLARAAHHSGSGSGSPDGQRIQLNSIASLTGSLQRGTPVDLLTVQVAPSDQPFYVRQVVLDKFTQSGWVQSKSNGSALQPLSSTFNYPVQPSSSAGAGADHVQIEAKFTVLNLGGADLPLLANPAALPPLSDGSWDPTTATVTGVNVKRGLHYVETAEQPSPSPAALATAPGWVAGQQPALDQRYLDLPAQKPSVKALVDKLTANATNAYEKAKAISDYFTDPTNNFVYSLNTATVTGGNALVSFLSNKKGFCQQYAAAAAVLMREAGLATRVVLGYTHRAPDATGTFTIKTSDAHAWVEVYFGGIGWVPFDPTPLTGADIAREVPLPWAQHTTAPSSSASATSGPSVSGRVVQPNTGPEGRAPQGQTSGATSGAFSYRPLVSVAATALVLLLLLLGPQLVRRQQRRRRLHRARVTGNPEPLWQELAAAATDQGVLWPATVTVGQVPGWLAMRGIDVSGTNAASAIAHRVERARFGSRLAGATIVDAAGSDSTGCDAVDGVIDAMRRWTRGNQRVQRLVSWWLPKSLFTSRDQWQR